MKIPLQHGGWLEKENETCRWTVYSANGEKLRLMSETESQDIDDAHKAGFNMRQEI